MIRKRCRFVPAVLVVVVAAALEREVEAMIEIGRMALVPSEATPGQREQAATFVKPGNLKCPGFAAGQEEPNGDPFIKARDRMAACGNARGTTGNPCRVTNEQKRNSVSSTYSIPIQ